jgi:sugar diacid utilization regulator
MDIHGLMQKLVEWKQGSPYGLWARNDAEDSWRRWSGIERIGAEAAAAADVSVEDELPEGPGDAESLFFVYGEPLWREALMFYPSGAGLSDEKKERLRSTIRELWLEEKVHRQQKEHEQWLMGLRELTSSLDLNELLLHIMRTALTVIPSASYGFFMMYEPETGLLVPRASVGMEESIYEFRVGPGEGISGKVFESGQGDIYIATEAFSRAMDNVSEVKLASLSKAFGSEADSVQAAMAVPVMMNKEKIGVMLVHQLQRRARLNERDLQRLQGFADQAAIAISNARLFAELEEKNRYLTRRNDIHDIFTKLSVEGKDLETVTRTMTEMIGLPVSFVDLTKDEWYPAAGDEQNKLDESNHRRLRHETTPWKMDVPDQGSIYIYPVLNGPVLLGCFAVKLRRPLQQLDSVVLEQGGAVAALEMMNTYSLIEMHFRGNQELFGELLSYREPKKLEGRLKGFGLSKHQSIFVAVLQLVEEQTDAKRRESNLRRIVAGIEKEFGRGDHLLFGAHDKVTILASAEDEKKQQLFVRKLSDAACKWSETSGTNIYGGVGGLYKGFEHAAKSNEEAGRSLAYLKSRGYLQIMRYGDIGINRLFINQDPDEIESYVQDVLKPLRSPKGRSGELERTLKTYMASNRASAITAEQLHIHTNTLYHRLRKIEELLDVSLDDPDDWLKLYLACHLSTS